MGMRSPSASELTSELARRETSGLTSTGTGNDRVTAIDRALAGVLARGLGSAPVRLVLWDGSELATADSRARARVYIASRKALVRLLVHPQLYFGECYADGSVEIDGDLPDLMTSLYDALGAPHGMHVAAADLYARFHRIHPARSRDNVHHHYDIGNDFYRLWLDERLVYTCAYFPNPDATLEQAQVAKLDHVCRKLRLKAGENVIEAGCGWGALALHMADRYGARVRAFNVSNEQIAYAREMAARTGLDDRVEFIEDDYRSVTGSCDAFVSVGMLEHVGPPSYHALGRLMRRVLVPDGRGFIHTIGRPHPQPTNPWIRRRIFPDGYTPALSEMMEIFEPHGFAVVDIENLRAHYARTLEHWFGRFEAAIPRVRAMFDEQFVRTWRLYLAGSIAAFRVGSMQLYQVLFARQAGGRLPLTRDDVYAAS